MNHTEMELLCGSSESQSAIRRPLRDPSMANQREQHRKAEALGVVVVLYERGPRDAEAVVSLSSILAADDAVRERIFPMIYDNSPTADVSYGSWVHSGDTTNPGLATAYNWAVDQAKAAGCEWLMLLDQDTTVTREFVLEVLYGVSHSSVASVLVPRLSHTGRVFSPHRPIRLVPKAVTACGMVQSEVCAFNSGMTIRLDALDEIGGFDESFPLDYLDHAMLYRLQRTGHQVSILKSELFHEFSLDPRSKRVSAERYRSALAAERRFYRIHHQRSARWWQSARAELRLAHNLVWRRDLTLVRLDLRFMTHRRVVL